MDTLRIHEDARGFLADGKLEERVAPGGIFTLLIPFSSDHAMFVDKPTYKQQEALMRKIAAGNFSPRSKIAITGVTHTERKPDFYQLENGTWIMRMDFANDGPEDIIVPTGVKIGKPFERPEKALEGKELMQAAENLSDINHVNFLTRSGTVIERERISDDILADSDNAFYPVAVVLPYTDEVGVLKVGPAINLAHVPSRKEGYEERYVNWHGLLSRNGRGIHRVILKRTRGDIAMPKGFAGIIRLQGLPGQVPHGLSTVLDDMPEHIWPAIAEHGDRHAGGTNIENPTAFVMDMYRVTAYTSGV